MTVNHPISFKEIPTLATLKVAYPGLKGLFFDMDGTIFNTEGHHAEAFLKIGADCKIRPPHSADVIHAMLMGKADYLVYDIVKDWEGFPKDWTVKKFVDTKNENLLEILATVHHSTYFPKNLHTLIKEAKTERLFVALVTSSEKIVTQKLIEIAGIEAQFDLILTRDDCPQHKPDPWPYLKALKVSGLAPSEVIIFEDSTVGLAAASASGSHVIKVEWF